MSVKTFPLPDHSYYGNPQPYSSGGIGMDPITTALGVGGMALDFFGRRKQNKQALKMAREQMAFQERMRNTAYQAAANDLEKAGLNRVLALGNAAASPGGASAPVVSETAGAAQTALAMQRQTAEIENIRANTRKAQIEGTTTAMSQENLFQQWRKLDQEVNNLRDQGKLTRAMTELNAALKRLRDYEGDIIQSEADLWNELRNINWDEASKVMQMVGPNGIKLVQAILYTMRGRK